MAWGETTVRDHNLMKGIVAELVGCVGPDVAKAMIVDLGR